MEPLMTKKDLAEHWKVSLSTIDNYIADGVITPVKGIPSIRFNPDYIRKLDGTPLEKFSPLERRRMQRENEELKAKLEKAEGALARAQAIITEAMYCQEKEA